ncbi:MAG: polysaccharide biosynthesis C-terminal domain-containing protein [[Actinobacillus] rossii]|nr:polysaccharide biosynthesis C-terminal domain-containing protein [[Actinobacillus] rossii]MDY5792911.1 polysaccharide biosynthesis C-terminal domain-containing protein [[Actinobacillus] rossii]
MAKNIFFSLLYQVVNFLVNFLIMPLILVHFGSHVNGLIQAIRQILNYVAFVGAGISESTVVSLYKPLNNQNYAQINCILNTCNKFFFKAGIIYIVIGLLVATIYPILTDSSLSYQKQFCLILILGMVGVSEFFIVGKYRALLVADQKLYVVYIIQIITALCSLFLTYILIEYHIDIVIIQLSVSSSYLLRMLFFSYYAKKIYPYLSSTKEIDWSSMDKRNSVIIHQLAGMISFGSQIILVSIVLGNEEASVYSVYSLIFSGLGLLLGTISSVLVPKFGSILAKEDKEGFLDIFTSYEIFFYLLSFSIYYVAYILILPFLSLYTVGITDGVNYIRNDTALLFIIMGISNSLRTPAATIINASGHYKETQRASIVEMCICLIMQLLLIIPFGINGVLIGSILAYLYRVLDVVYYSNIHILHRDYFITVRIILLNLFLFVMLCYLFPNDFVKINKYMQFILWGVGLISVAFLVFSLFNALFHKCNFLKILKR